jgi:hypothetical protein
VCVCVCVCVCVSALLHMSQRMWHDDFPVGEITRMFLWLNTSSSFIGAPLNLKRMWIFHSRLVCTHKARANNPAVTNYSFIVLTHKGLFPSHSDPTCTRDSPGSSLCDCVVTQQFRKLPSVAPPSFGCPQKGREFWRGILAFKCLCI